MVLHSSYIFFFSLSTFWSLLPIPPLPYCDLFSHFLLTWYDLCTTRAGLWVDLLASHCVCHGLLWETSFICHWDCCLWLWHWHLCFLPINWNSGGYYLYYNNRIDDGLVKVHCFMAVIAGQFHLHTLNLRCFNVEFITIVFAWNDGVPLHPPICSVTVLQFRYYGCISRNCIFPCYNNTTVNHGSLMRFFLIWSM